MWWGCLRIMRAFESIGLADAIDTLPSRTAQAAATRNFFIFIPLREVAAADAAARREYALPIKKKPRKQRGPCGLLLHIVLGHTVLRHAFLFHHAILRRGAGLHVASSGRAVNGRSCACSARLVDADAGRTRLRSARVSARLCERRGSR
jgi:hypothetical protein